MSDKVKKLPVRHKNSYGDGLFLQPPPATKCVHYNGPFEVDETAEECVCLACGEKVSPMFVLKRLMKKESQWMRSHERYQDEMKRLSKRRRTKCMHCDKFTRIIWR